MIPAPSPVQLAETAVSVAARLGLTVLFRQQLVEAPVIVLVRQRPGQAGGGGSFQIPVNGRLSDGTASGNFFLAQAQAES